MLILAVEISTSAGSVALMDAPLNGKDSEVEGKCLAEHTLNLPGTHSEKLMPAIEHLLREASLPIRKVESQVLPPSRVRQTSRAPCPLWTA